MFVCIYQFELVYLLFQFKNLHITDFRILSKSTFPRACRRGYEFWPFPVDDDVDEHVDDDSRTM